MSMELLVFPLSYCFQMGENVVFSDSMCNSKIMNQHLGEPSVTSGRPPLVCQPDCSHPIPVALLAWPTDLPVAQFLRKVHVQDVGQDIDQLGGIAQRCTDGVSGGAVLHV